MNWLTKSDINFFQSEANNAGSNVLSQLVTDNTSNEKIQKLQNQIIQGPVDAGEAAKKILQNISKKLNKKSLAKKIEKKDEEDQNDANNKEPIDDQEQEGNIK